MTSPTQLSRKRLKETGWTSEITEHWNSFAKIRQDLFGFGDILAMRPPTALIIQTTTQSHVAERRAKIQKIPEALMALACGILVEVWGWEKKDKKWVLTIDRLTKDNKWERVS